MGHGVQGVTAAPRHPSGRAQSMSTIYTVMLCLAMLILLQFLLLAVSLEAYFRDHPEVVLPATLGSACCCMAACWLTAYIFRIRG